MTTKARNDGVNGRLMATQNANAFNCLHVIIPKYTIQPSFKDAKFYRGMSFLRIVWMYILSYLLNKRRIT